MKKREGKTREGVCLVMWAWERARLGERGYDKPQDLVGGEARSLKALV